MSAAQSPAPKPQEPPVVEHRALSRNRVLLAARFVYGDKRQFTPECTIRDIAAAGAAVRFDSDLPLPPEPDRGPVRPRASRPHRLAARRLHRPGLRGRPGSPHRTAQRSAPPRMGGESDAVRAHQ